MSGVPGEVLATEETHRNVRGFPTNKKLAETVVNLPERTKGKVVADEIPRTLEAGKVIKFSIEHGRGKWFKVKDIYSILDHEGESIDGLHVLSKANVLGKSRVSIRDKDEKPIILAREEMLKINKSYYIDSKTPLFDADEQTDTEEGVSFYPMFKVRDIDDSHVDHRTVLVWNGNNYQPLLRIVAAQLLPDRPAGNLVPPRKNDLLLVDPHDMDIVHALLAKRSDVSLESRVGWDCVVAPGADVGLCMILSVILDDMVGWFA